MSQRANPTVVGGFVVGALALLVIGVLVFGSGAVLRERVLVVAFFTGNVRGLQEGSAVEFRGVRVGSVKQIRLLLDVDSNELLIPVYMELETRSLVLSGSAKNTDNAEVIPFLDELVAQGLRARLDLKSIVTGQLAVGLDMHPGTEIARIGAVDHAYELPTVPSTLDRVFEALQDLPLQEIAAKLINTLDRTSELVGDEKLATVLRDAAGTAADARLLMSELKTRIGPAVDDAREMLRETRTALQELSGHATATLGDYRVLAHSTTSRFNSLANTMEKALTELGGIRASLDARIAPVAESAESTLAQARGALTNARNLLAEDSRTQYNLNVALEELAAAARSLRLMADYLERNPDALLKGKGL